MSAAQDRLKASLGIETNEVRNQSDREVKTTRNRQRGIFNGTNQKLQVLNGIPGYVLRWFNDTPGRINIAENGGWEFANQEEVQLSESNKVVERNSDLGTRVRAIVGTTETNEPMYAYLMKIKEEYRKEDEDDLMSKIDSTETAMLRDGGLNVDRLGNNSYIPDDRKKAFEMRSGKFRN